jgi:glycosyltransferase involved in cell wall biosynthesis
MNNNNKLTVFIGIFNGEKYLASIFDQINNQDTNEFKLLIVDNSSEDNSFEIIENWPQKRTNLSFQIIKNPKNLGAGGSLNLNLRDINTPWFTTMHQDDFYKKNHISTLLKLINTADDEVSGVSATMGSMTSEGKKMKSTPRSTWFGSNLDKYDQFIQNIKSQSIPFPCSAFKTEIYKKNKVLAHNPSFSDTEQTLKMLCYGKFLVTSEETMLYRENPLSESHSLNDYEREIGAYIGLNRVFASESFFNMMKSLEKEKLFEYLKRLTNSIEERISDPKLLLILQISLIENILEKTGSENSDILQLLSNYYTKFSSSQTLSNLSNLGNFTLDYVKLENKINIKSSNKKKILWDKYLNSQIPIPNKIHKSIIKNIYKIILKIKPNHRWSNK